MHQMVVVSTTKFAKTCWSGTSEGHRLLETLHVTNATSQLRLRTGKSKFLKVAKIIIHPEFPGHQV